MRKLFILIILLKIGYIHATTTIHTYFENTNYEFNVFHIKGEQPGATMMILAAVHGDETAPFYVADTFTNITLKKGNLIIIPRANVPAIQRNRRFLNADMNRRFFTPEPRFYEDQVVDIIKKYMHQSDLFLNLHEGGGFYRDTYEGPNHNPGKYGQCLIADTDVYILDDKVINLREIADIVIEQINSQIDIEEYLYRFNNHNTLNADSRHLEQRGSASFYGLTRVNIPSFGVEVSDLLPSEDYKYKYLYMILEAFMDYSDIVPYITSISFPDPELYYLHVAINDEKRYVERNDTIYLDENSRLKITAISTNYTHGNSVDVIGHGNQNDLNKEFIITSNTEILVRKDSHEIATIPIRVRSSQVLAYEGFRAKIIDDDSFHNILPGDTLRVTLASEFEIIGSLNNDSNINITIPGIRINTIQGRRIVNTDLEMNNRYAINPERNLYEIHIRRNNELIATSYLQINPIVPAGLHISLNDNRMVIAPGDTLQVSYGDILFIHDVELNQLLSSRIRVNFAGYVLNPARDAEDRGGNIILDSRGLIPSFAVNPERDRYEIHVLYNRIRWATYTVQINN